MSKSIWRISEAQMTMYLMRETNNFESTTYVPFVTMLDSCDEKRCTGCDELIETTAAALNNIVASMLLAV
ncbi:hypothetical protein EDB89DRAFT_2072604 [Lactarius sanguifluus]|nr:hypothetical protein EDB89DRAFT_2072604 [Lactarius sanguifluus]